MAIGGPGALSDQCARRLLPPAAVQFSDSKHPRVLAFSQCAALRARDTRHAIDVLLFHFGSPHVGDIRPWLRETT